MRKARVRVPASTSNLGPGFDTLGLALELYNLVEMEEASRGLEVVVEGEGLEIIEMEGEENLTYRAAQAAFAYVGHRPPGLRMRLVNYIPMEKGLGSSAAACLGGIVAAIQMAGARLSKGEILRLALPFEGHPDNLVPSLVGGFTVSVVNGDQVKWVKVPFPKDLKAVTLIPALKISTMEARQMLPRMVPFSDAAFNVGRVALFVGALAAGQLGLLGEGARDRLHQPYRAPLLPGMDEVLEEGYRAGARACFLSGAGSALIALVEGPGEEVGQRMLKTWQGQFGVPCEYRVLALDEQGLVVL